MKNGTWVALLLSLMSIAAAVRADDGDTESFRFLWKHHIARKEIQTLLRSRHKNNESESVRSRLDSLIAGNLDGQEERSQYRDTICRDTWVPDYSPAGGYGAYDITGRHARWSAERGFSTGATVGIGLWSGQHQSHKEALEMRQARESAEKIRQALLGEAELIRYNLRTAKWELKTLAELENAIASGDKTQITKAWLEKSRQTILASEKALAAQTGLSLMEIADIVNKY